MLQKSLISQLLILVVLQTLLFGWLVFFVASVAEPSLKMQVLAAMAFFGLLSLLLARMLMTRIVRPIQSLTDTARRISAGEHALRVEVAGGDEISELSQAFNQMNTALADAQHNLEAKVAERTRALLISEERYMLAEGAVNDGIWDWNIVNHEYYLSPRWNKILGYAEGELPNVESIFFDLIHPDDKAAASAAFSRHLEHQERYATELRLRHKDGSYRWVLDRGEAIRDADGHPLRMVGSITDITERKAAEAELLRYREHLEELVTLATTEVKAIVQTAVNGVITIDTLGAIRTFNPAAEKLFGWTAAEVSGRNVSMLMAEPIASAHDGYIRRFLESKEARIIGIEREVTALRKDGSSFPANLAVGHAFLSEGRHLFVGFIADISLQKQAQQELQLAKEAAEAATKAKANFLANMSHEIRTPMNTVIGFAEVVLQNPNLEALTRNHVQIILHSAQHLLAVINDILDFSKIEAGKVTLEAVCFNLPALVQETLQTIGLRAAEKGLRIEFSIAADAAQFVLGDPNRLRQVILNLVGNSVKFTEAGFIRLNIAKYAGEDMLYFAISDSGIGMTAEQTAGIFDSFSQADTSTSRRFGGTGLGTTISKQLVELMGGRIWVDSELGVGSTFNFTVRLPAVNADANCLYQSAQLAMPVGDFYSPRSFKVLLAEDIEANARLAILRLEQQGHRVTWVKNGQEAVEAFKIGGFDLILMDLQMPVLDGLDATRQIRRLEADNNSDHLPILALTASVLEQEREQCTLAGMDAVVNKPININELLEKMEKLTPVGAGTPRVAIIPVVPAQTSIDFSGLAGVADYAKGLETWRDALVYAEALRNFAVEHAEDALQILQLNTEGENNFTAMHRLLHTLKGLSGNLALSAIHTLSSELDAEVKAGNPQNLVERLGALDTAIKTAVAATRSLQMPPAVPVENSKRLASVEHVSGILHSLLSALDTLNPENAAPLLQQLSASLEAADFNSLQRQIDHFDFAGAKLTVENLIARYPKEKQRDAT